MKLSKANKVGLLTGIAAGLASGSFWKGLSYAAAGRVAAKVMGLADDEDDQDLVEVTEAAPPRRMRGRPVLTVVPGPGEDEVA